MVRQHLHWHGCGPKLRAVYRCLDTSQEMRGHIATDGLQERVANIATTVRSTCSLAEYLPVRGTELWTAIVPNSTRGAKDCDP